ncbi:hypothetical protein KCP78_17265 [Salmonella enterica subsp. enterica]|nr:hypothetical protein KCP78_17265 [Salmonella enterica subsp. enterica]
MLNARKLNEAYPPCGRDIFPPGSECRYPAQGWLLQRLFMKQTQTALRRSLNW